MLSLFTLPTPASVLATTSEWSSPFFTELLPFGLVIAGITIGALLVLLLIRGIISAFYTLVNRNKDED